MVGVHGEPPTLDPYSPLASDLTRALVRPVYPSLYRLAPDGTPTASLAASLDASPRRAVVTLRRWRWSTGRRITARDVVASARRATAPSGFASLEGARARGRYSVAFVSDDVVDWEDALATAAYVLPQGRASESAGGPYRMTRVVPGLGFTYKRNPEWSGKESLLDSVTVRYAISLDILIRLLETDRLDAAWLTSGVNLESRLDELGIEHEARLGWESIELDLSGWERSADDIRRLISGMDRRAIEKGFVRADGRVSDTLAPSPGPNGADGPFKGLERGPGGGEGTLQLAAPIGDELIEDTQRLLQAQLDVKALDVELVNVEPRTLYGEWSVDHTVDALLKRRQGAPFLEGDTGSPATPTRVPLFHVESVVGWRPPLRGAVVNPTIEGPFWNLEEWFLGSP